MLIVVTYFFQLQLQKYDAKDFAKNSDPKCSLSSDAVPFTYTPGKCDVYLYQFWLHITFRVGVGAYFCSILVTFV